MARNKPFTKTVNDYLKSKVDEMTGFEDDDLACELNDCESPIEELMFMSLTNLFNHVRRILPEYDYLLFTQKEFSYSSKGTYRADIALTFSDMDLEFNKFFIIECDGHEWHEKTKEQARADKKRERYFSKRGYTVIRFSGSEIVEDPDACADEVLTIAKRQMEVFQREVGKYI